MVSFDTASMKNFKDEAWTEYGREFRHLMIDIDDVEDSDMLIELPRVVRFIDEGLQAARANSQEEAKGNGGDDDASGTTGLEDEVKAMMIGGGAPKKSRGGVFVHCAAGKSRSVSAVIAYLLWRYPKRFNSAAASDPGEAATPSRRETARDAVQAALALVQRTRPMAEPNDGFMRQLELWWEMGCPADTNMEGQPAYQRWAYKREVEENVAVGQAPSRLRFEDEEQQSSSQVQGTSVRCKMCRRTLATGAFVVEHSPLLAVPPADVKVGGTAVVEGSSAVNSVCQHVFIEPLSWMRPELEKGSLSGRLLCPNARCGAGVGRYDWKGLRCTCGGWVTPAFSLQRGRIDEMRGTVTTGQRPGDGVGIRMPPGARRTSHV
jgi:dual specificity phosphatase 12